MVYDFSSTPMQEIIYILKNIKDGDIEFEAINPDLGSGLYAGQNIEIDGKSYLHHSLKAWVGLAELLECRMQMPIAISEYKILIRYQRLAKQKSFHDNKNIEYAEKYGSNSIFSNINKLEEPTFAWYYDNALDAVGVKDRTQILNLGINKGDEFVAIRAKVDKSIFENINMVGIDHSSSAITQAQKVLDEKNVKLLCHDINALKELDIPKSDLVISIGTLQSPNINTKILLMSLAQEYMSIDGAMILGFPNTRWKDGEMIYGAKAPHYPYPEMSMVIKDIYWIKKYLQQHKYRVTVTGREYLFLVATRIGLDKS